MRKYFIKRQIRKLFNEEIKICKKKLDPKMTLIISKLSIEVANSVNLMLQTKLDKLEFDPITWSIVLIDIILQSSVCLFFLSAQVVM